MNGSTAGWGGDPLRRPRLRRGLAIARTPHGLLLEGGLGRQLLTGTAALSLLPLLLPLLDGRRDPAQIGAELSLDRDQLDRALGLLDGYGLLEWVRPEGVARFAAEHVAAYMSRTVGITDSCPSADDLAGQLASATVLLVAPSALAQPIAEDLRQTGVGTVTSLAAAQAADAAAGITGPCVITVFDDPAAEHVLGTLVSASRERDRAVLRFSGTASSVEVGPVFRGFETACVRCFRRSQVPEGGSHPLLGAEEGAPAEQWSLDAGAAELLASLVVSALLGLLTRQQPVPPSRRLVRTALPGHLTGTFDTETFDVGPDLECGSCAGGTPPQDPASRALLGYEWRMGKMLPSLEPDSVSTPAEQGRLTTLQRLRDSFAYAPRRELSVHSSRWLPQTAGSVRGPDESVLAAILARTAGFRPATNAADRTPGSRWAPSGGDMASVAVYLSTEADPFALPGTIFRYDDIEHQVLSIRSDRLTLGRILAGTDLDAERTDVAIMLVGTVGRLRKKYGDFAWRLTHLDAGCAALQLRLVAADYGLRATFASSWPTELADLLELDPVREVVTAVAGICAQPGPHAERLSPCQ